MKVFKQEVFQGNLSMKKYFEGWYFKHVSADLIHAYSFIPGISLSDKTPHAFIQVVNGVAAKSRYIKYDLNMFSWENDKLYVRIGDSYFTGEGINLNINDGSTKITGKIDYKNTIKYPKSVLSPGIMGWYSYVPYMECKHAIVSITHDLIGKVEIDGKEIDFTAGKGYIEKDWGTSFPSEWLWLQSNNFSAPNASLSVSVAKIPWLGRFFMGFIAFFYDGGRIYRFATYNKSRITKLLRDDDNIYISMENNSYSMDIRVLMGRRVGLIAPKMGDMARMLEESIDSECIVTLLDKQRKIIHEDTGKRAGLEWQL